MRKNIIFCADGTWNGPGQDEDYDRVTDPTNVFKLFANLDGVDSPQTTRLADEQERSLATLGGDVRQVAKYVHGVGDSDNFLVKVLGGAGGAGLITRIVRGYTFISRNYAVGDRIFILGFSRGAYTARALAGLIAMRGLLDATRIDLTNKEQAYRLGSAEWFEYRRRALHSKGNVLKQLEEIAFDLPGFLTRLPTAPRVTDVTIEAVAVWDTVGSLGIPEYNRHLMRLDAFQFADTALSGKVQHGLHAVAVDEQRSDFTPTLWDADARILQVLFPGGHSDVGGGYPQKAGQSGLSDGALSWIMAELTGLQVIFAPSSAYLPSPDASGVAHQPWIRPPWNVLPRTSRVFRLGLMLHRSVLDRIKCGTVPTELDQEAYDPQNLSEYIAAGRAKTGVNVA
jgi:uncharacterized protein (DUF2235 family)